MKQLSGLNSWVVLEDGTRLPATQLGVAGKALGEIVFTTGMTGYQETLSDPSYAGQIVVMTAPHIGNTGMNRRDMESRKLWVEGLIVRDISPVPSNFRSEISLPEQLQQEEIVAVGDVDTRALTRRIRDRGAMRAGIFCGEAAAMEPEQQLVEVRAQPPMAGSFLAGRVSVSMPRRFSALNAAGPPLRVALLDLGVKLSTVEQLRNTGFEVELLPQNSTVEQVLALNPDALFYSNGPGDPASCEHQVELLQELLRRGLPYFGICFGNQLLGRALGFPTKKLLFGHRGINQPVLDRDSQRVEITAQNHGFAVDLPLKGISHSPTGFGRVQVSHYSLNDQVVEGLRCLDIPARSVQYHPEAAAGPHDSRHLFHDFAHMVKQQKAANA